MRISDCSSDVCSSDLVIVGGEARIDVDAQAYGLPVVQRADHLVVVLGDHAQLRHADRLAGLARTAAGGTHDAVVAVGDAEGSQYVLPDEELAHFLCQFAAFRIFLDELGALVVAAARHRELPQALKPSIYVALHVGLGTGLRSEEQTAE